MSDGISLFGDAVAGVPVIGELLRDAVDTVAASTMSLASASLLPAAA